MSLLFETIKLVDGIPQNTSYHMNRIEIAFRDYFLSKPSYRLSEGLFCSQRPLKGTHRLKFIYDTNSYDVEIESYHIKKVKAFLIVKDEHIEYSFKFHRRDIIEKWQSKMPEDTDIIFVKNGLITDASYSNLVFKTKDQDLFTPINCLLKGTKRQKYIDEKLIIPATIKVGDLTQFTQLSRINAMMDLGEDDWLKIDRVGPYD